MKAVAKDSIERLYRIEIKPLFRYFKKEKLVFWFACLYLFFEYVRIQLMYPVIDVAPWTFLSILGMMLLAFKDPKIKWVSSTGNKMMIAMFVVIIVSSLLSKDVEYSFSHLDSFYNWMLIYFVLIAILNSEKRFFFFMLIYLIFNFKMSQHGFVSWMQRGFSFDADGVQGPPGWFSNSGELGIQLCVYLPLSIYFIKPFYANWNWIKKGIFLLMPFTAIGAAIASSSRGALLGIAASGLVVLWKSPYKIKGTIFLVILSVAVYNAIPEESLKRFESSGTDSTSQQRLEIWKIGLNEMKDNPFFGVGFENWRPYYRQKYPQYNHYTAFVHNIFIQAGTELGYVGLSLFIVMVLYSFVANRQTRRFAKKTDNQFFYNLAHGFDVSLVGMLVSASFVTVLYYPYFWIHFTFVVAMNRIAMNQFRSYKKDKKKNKDNSEKKSKTDSSSASALLLVNK